MATKKYISANQKRHQNAKWWQIIFPIIAITILFLVLFVMIALGSRGILQADIAQIASVSVIWMSLPVLVLSLLALAILVLFILLNSKLEKKIPYLFLKLQVFIYQLAIQIRKAADSSVEPVVKVRQFSAGFKEAGRKLTTIFKRT